MSKVKLRSKDNCLQILHQSPGPEHLEIAGSRLPTFEQVLLCYIVTMRKKRAEDSSNKNKLSINVSKIVAAQVIAHYEKGGIEHRNLKVMTEKILQLHGEYYNLTKLTNKNKNQRVLKFREKMQKTMILWPKDALSKMQLRAE